MTNWLSSLHPTAPYLVGPLVAFVAVWCWRTFAPASFERLPKAAQSLPAVLISAIMGASTATEAREALVRGILGAILGPTAIGWHHAAKASPLPYGNAAPKPPSIPPSSGAVVLLAALAGLASQACAGTFEEARLAGVDTLRAAPPDVAYCRSLDASRTTWGALGKSSALVAGGAGLATIPVESHDARVGLVAGSVGAAAFAAYAVAKSEGKAASWVRECSQ